MSGPAPAPARRRAVIRRGAIAAALLPAWPGAATEPALTWRVAAVPGQPVARFAWAAGEAVQAVADGAVGFLLRPVAPAELPAGAWRLAWRWRVDAAPPPTDPAVAGADDRPAAVHVLFPDPAGGVRRWLRARALGAAFAGRAVTYMWGGTAPAGTTLPNPHLVGDGVLVVRRDASALLGVWQDELADPAADYRAAFGTAAPVPSHLALSTDTDDRGGRAIAWIAAPRFRPA